MVQSPTEFLAQARRKFPRVSADAIDMCFGWAVKDQGRTKAPETRAEVEAIRERFYEILETFQRDVLRDPNNDPRTDVQRALDHSFIAGYLLRDKLPLRPGVKIDLKETLYKVGVKWWTETLGKEPDADITRMVELMLKAVEGDEDQTLFMLTEEGQIQCVWSALWAHHGFPTVQLASHRYAAALMATSIPSGDIKPPWPTFLLELPTGMFETEHQGSSWPLTHVLFTTQTHFSGEEVWHFRATSSYGINLWRNQTLDMMRAGSLEGDVHLGAFNLELAKGDERRLALISRLVLNTCVAMTDSDNVRTIGKHRKASSEGPRRFAKEPELRTYRVGKPIQLDVRPALTSYVRGEIRNSPTVQFLVRGHWRDQACGPKLSKRKTIWIEPFWKGDPEAPINVRAHVASDGEMP
jgi:hypothetical protein